MTERPTSKKYKNLVYEQPQNSTMIVGPEHGGSGFICELYKKLNRIGSQYNRVPPSLFARSKAPNNPLVENSWLIKKNPPIYVNFFLHGEWTTLEIISSNPEMTLKTLPKDLVDLIKEYNYKPVKKP